MRKLFPFIFILIVLAGSYICNRIVLQRVDSTKITVGGTIYNIDNYWYDSQFSNLMNSGQFTVDTRYHEYQVRRTPFYPIFVGVPLYFLGEKNGLLLILCTQILLHLLASYLIGQILLKLTDSKRLQIIGILLYGLCPFIFIYSFYTITESLTPFFVVSVLYCLVRYEKSGPLYKRRWIILTGIALGLAVLLRPQLGLFGLPMGIYFLFRQRNKIQQGILNAAFFGIIFLAILAPWIYRNYRITGELIIAEKWYYEDPMDFGRGHTYIRTWVNSFTNPANMSVENLGNKIRQSKDLAEAETYINSFMEGVPRWVYATNDSMEVKKAFLMYATCALDRDRLVLQHAGTELRELNDRQCEWEVKGKFKEFTNRIKTAHPLQYYGKVPAETFLRGSVFHSFSSAWPMLDIKYLPKIAIVSLKAIFFILNVFLWVSFCLVVLSKKNIWLPKNMRLTFLFMVLILIIFHIGIFRYFEARYLLPVYPIMIICSSFILDRVIGYRKRLW